jgi:hypothetical protein
VSPIGLLDSINPGALLFLAVIAVLLFGKQLPDVASKWGKKFAEFRRNGGPAQGWAETSAARDRAIGVVMVCVAAALLIGVRLWAR